MAAAATKTSSSPVFLALLEEAIKTMRESARNPLHVDVSEDVELPLAYDDGPFANEDVRSSPGLHDNE